MSGKVACRWSSAAWFGLAFASLWLCVVPPARAGLSLEMDLVRYSYLGNRYYYFAPNLNTNGNAPAVPFGTYYVASPGYPTNGASAIYTFDTTGFNQTGGGPYGFNTFDAPDFNSSFIKNLTNGQWSIFVTNTVTTNVYRFTITANVTTNDFPDVVITFPAYGATNVPTQPTFTWQGPTNYDDVAVYDANASTTLAPTATSWPSPNPLNQGASALTVHYDRFPTNLVSCSTPVDSLSHAISSWVSTAHFQDYFISDFTVGTVDPGGTGHTLVAHYPFDGSSGPVLNAANDTSGNGYNMSFGGGFGAQGGANLTAISVAGSGAVVFHDGDGSSAGYLGWSPSTPAPLLSALAGSFSVCGWIKTTQSLAGDTDPAYYGAGIVSADVPGLANDVIPLALTGSKIGFNTGGSIEDDTINSATSVNDGYYHFVVVTRNQATGQKIIYIDGRLDTFSSGSTNLLNAPQKLTIGALADASSANPNTGSYNNGYDGFLDDLQFYAGVLSSNEVALLFANPGATAPDRASQDFNAALNTTGLNWSPTGDALWFVETTNTQDGVSAAQSGSVTGSRSSVLSVTVTGPGSLTFFWSSIANDPNNGFDYEFDIDGSYANDISGDNGWQQDGPYSISAGTHTLSWTVTANGDADPTQAGFLDEVSFSNQAPPPVITLNPFDQTNAPGYSVALLAAATSNLAITWQWFKVGNGSPIPNATNALFIPTNSGTAGVAGSYYAVASDTSGSAPTTSATVSFVNTPLPTDWSKAFKSPSANNNTLTEELYLAALPDSTGNLYAAGTFTGTNTLGSQTFVSANGAYETELVKQTASGALIWALAMTNNGNGSSQPEAVAPAPGNGIYVLGDFFGTNWLGTNKLVDTGGTSVYLARFDANGNNLWIRTITCASNAVFTGFNSVAADPAGNVTIAALISGYTTFSSSNALTATNILATGQGGALAHYDANGKLLWAGTPGAWPQNLAYSAGRLYCTMFSPTAGFSGVTNATDRRFSLAALNPTNGQALWLRGVGAPQADGNPLGIILDIPLISVFGTNVTLVGTAYGSNATFGPYTVSWNGSSGQYFARYDTNGTPQLATAFGSPTTQTYATAPDAAGNIYVAGDFDTYSFFGKDIIAAPHEDAIGNGYFSHCYLAKFDRNGNPLWARPAVSEFNFVNCRSLAVVPDGVWASTACKSTTYFGTNLVTSSITCIGSPTCTLTYHQSGAFGKITEATALPVTLLNPHDNGVTFQFSFLSEAGFTHAVQYRTNLLLGTFWQTCSNVPGDGTLKTIAVPLSLFSPSSQGYLRVSTQ